MMPLGKKRVPRLAVLLLVGNLLFIWGKSLLPASLSGALSQWLRDLLGLMSGEGTGGSDGVLRKIAHFSEFCTLGILLGWIFSALKKRKQTVVCLTAVCGLTVACVDEMLQHFAAGRAPRLTDVAIDCAGVLAGIGLLGLGYAIKMKQSNQFGGKQQ